MFYYLYEIRNILSNKIYVGVHKTSKMDDGYMGSGKVIKRAIEKHGIENFTKVILETFENAEAMYAREAEVVTDAFLLREDVYNLRRGGFGGFDYINLNNIDKHNIQHSNETKTKISESMTGKKRTSETIEKIKLCNRRTNFSRGIKVSEKLLGKQKTDEHKQRISASLCNYMWITDGVENKKVSKDIELPFGWKKGRVLPKVKETA